MKRILIVEDDLDIRAGLQLVLSDKYVILEASNGSEALQMLACEAVDLMLLDMFMPILDGMGVLTEMAAKALATPVIVMTAQKDLGDRSKALGVETALLKPFDLAELEQCIARVLEPDDGCPPAADGSGGSQARSLPKEPETRVHDDGRKQGWQDRPMMQRQPVGTYSLSA